MKYLIHALILLVGFGGIRGYYWYNEAPPAASKQAKSLIESLDAADKDSSGWKIGKPEKENDEYLVYEKAGDPLHMRVNPDGRVIAWNDKEPDNKTVLSAMSKDKARIKAAYSEAREKIESRYLIKLEGSVNGTEALVKGEKDAKIVVKPDTKPETKPEVVKPAELTPEK